MEIVSLRKKLSEWIMQNKITYGLDANIYPPPGCGRHHIAGMCVDVDELIDIIKLDGDKSKDTRNEGDENGRR
jgi:hypothetical protein